MQEDLPALNDHEFHDAELAKDNPISDRRDSDFSLKIRKIQELAQEFNLKPDPEELENDPHFWFLILLIFDSRREVVLKIFEEFKISNQIGDATVIEKVVQKIALESAMEITKAGDIDKLTGAWTRGSLLGRIEFFQMFTKEMSLDSEYILLLYFIDIDHFKTINDARGHSVGDEVLKRLIEVVKNCIRDEDAIFRYGGEEFCVLQFVNKHNLKKAATERGITVQELIKQMVEDFRLSIRQGLAFRFGSESKETQLTISLGAIQIDPDEDGAGAVNRADGLMYVAKKTGRDRSFTQWDKISSRVKLWLIIKKTLNGNNKW